MEIAIINPILASPNIRPQLLAEPTNPIEARDLAQVNIVELARSIADLGHHVSVYAADVFLGQGEIQLGRGLVLRSMRTILRKPFHPGVMPLTPDLASSAPLRAADVIQAGDYHQPATFFAARAAASERIPFVVWQEALHRMRAPAGWYQRGYEAFVGGTLRSTVARYVPRTTKAVEFLNALGTPPALVGPWIPTGIDSTVYRPEPSRLSPEDFGWKRSCSLIVMVVRLHREKGVDLAISALARMRRTGLDVGLVVRGSGPELPSLKAFAAQTGVGEYVRFLDRRSRPEMVQLYNSAEIVLLTSRNDLLPFALLEAGACGRPCIATRVGAVADVIVDGVTGRLVEPESVPDITAAIAKLLGDDDLRSQMGRNARLRIESQFDMRSVALRLAATYEELRDSERTN